MQAAEAPIGPAETGPPAAASRACHDGTSRTTPSTIMIAAAATPEHAGIDAEPESDQREQQAEHGERQRQTGGQRDRAERMGDDRRAEHDRDQRQHARRQDRQQPGREGQRERVMEMLLEALVEQRCDRGFLGVADGASLSRPRP